MYDIQMVLSILAGVSAFLLVLIIVLYVKLNEMRKKYTLLMQGSEDKNLEDMFIKRLAYYFSEINALHPFREGNGRSQREFIRSLALKNGYLIYFDRVSEEEMLLASQKTFLCDYEDMEKIIAKCIKKK